MQPQELAQRITSKNSPAILADAACTRTCRQLSVVLLTASIGYELTGLGCRI